MLSLKAPWSSDQARLLKKQYAPKSQRKINACFVVKPLERVSFWASITTYRKLIRLVRPTNHNKPRTIKTLSYPASRTIGPGPTHYYHMPVWSCSLADDNDCNKCSLEVPPIFIFHLYLFALCIQYFSGRDAILLYFWNHRTRFSNTWNTLRAGAPHAFVLKKVFSAMIDDKLPVFYVCVCFF